MKNLIIICLLGLMSCDPPRVDPLTLNYVTLKAEINLYDKFVLGDTLKVRINVPDSLEYTYYDESGLSKQTKIFVNFVQEIVTGPFVYKFDTLNIANGGLASYKDDDLNFSYKIINNFQKHPFYRELILIPKTKGAFFVEFRYNPAVKIKVNNDFEANLSILYDESLNLNTDMYCKYVLISQPSQSFEKCLSDIGTSRRFYTFRVE